MAKTKSKSLFRQPGTQHFQLVHRSQRDPLINDPEASQHVLKPIVRANDAKGKVQFGAALENDASSRENVGEASLYGVYYDDTEYDYMQHLRQIGIHEEGVESIWIEAPGTSSGGKNKNLKFKEGALLPADALPSRKELSMETIIASHEAIPSELRGLQPDMNPHLRQTLEALDDDAFIDGDIDADDFFGELLEDGELDEGEELEYEFQEWGAEDDQTQDLPQEEEIEDGRDWESRFKEFQKQKKAAAKNSDEGSYDGASEGLDTVGTLPHLAVIGGKRRKTGTTDGSGYSLSSSAVYRNEGLTTLDARFDQLMTKEYGDDDADGDEASQSEDDEVPELINTSTLDSLANDFLNNYELVGGRKLRQSMPGESGAEKLESMRSALRGSDKDSLSEEVKRAMERQERSRKSEEIIMPAYVEDKQDRWDVETILSTYSNLENHPKVIRAREIGMKPKKVAPIIQIDRKSGLPVVSEVQEISEGVRKVTFKDDYSDGDQDSDDTNRPVRATITRPENESREDRRARKAAVKEEKQARRKEKKAKKELFASERVAAMKTMSKMSMPVKVL